MLNAVASHAAARVLIVITSSQRRGAEVEGTELARQLQGLGLNVRVVALVAGDRSSRLDVEELGTRPLGVRTLRSLRRQARNCDVAVAYGSRTLTACAIALAGSGVPFVYRSIGDPAQWVRGRLHRKVWTILYRRASRIVALWPGGENSIQELFGISPDRVQIIPNARDEERFFPATVTERTRARRRLGVPVDVPVAAVIGSLSEEKQVDLAIEAISNLPSVVLVVAGDGPLRAGLEDLARRVAPGRVRFLGVIDDVRWVLHASDVLVMTSRTEGMPGAVIEAGLCGIPTVAPDIGALKSLVVHGTTGMITESTTPEAVARAIEALLAISQRAGAAARERLAAECSWTTVVPRWQACLEEVRAMGSTSAARR